DRKLLELAKCVATRPKLILLDEVMAGLTLAEADLPVSIIRQLRDTGITFVLVEHVIPIVMKTADRIIVMTFGEKIAEGTPAEVLANQSVRDAYSGAAIGVRCRIAKRALIMFSIFSPVSASASTRWPARCKAASSRCWRSAAGWSRNRSFSFSMSHRSVCRH